MSFREGFHQQGLPRRLRWTVTSASAVAVAAMGLTPAVAATSQVPHAAHLGVAVTQPPGAVSPHPAAGTPELVQTGKTQQVIRQLVACGGTMYAVGSFTQIGQG